MMDTFSIKEYLIDHHMMDDEDYELIPSQGFDNPAWSIGPYGLWETAIHLATLINFFHQYGMLDNIKFALREVGNLDFQIDIDEIDSRYQYPGNFNWAIVTEVIDFLIPYMAGSNVSYLGGQLISE